MFPEGPSETKRFFSKVHRTRKNQQKYFQNVHPTRKMFSEGPSDTKTTLQMFPGGPSDTKNVFGRSIRHEKKHRKYFRSFVCSFVRSFVRSCVRSFVGSLVVWGTNVFRVPKYYETRLPTKISSGTLRLHDTLFLHRSGWLVFSFETVVQILNGRSDTERSFRYWTVVLGFETVVRILNGRSDTNSRSDTERSFLNLRRSFGYWTVVRVYRTVVRILNGRFWIWNGRSDTATVVRILNGRSDTERSFFNLKRSFGYWTVVRILNGRFLIWNGRLVTERSQPVILTDQTLPFCDTSFGWPKSGHSVTKICTILAFTYLPQVSVTDCAWRRTEVIFCTKMMYHFGNTVLGAAAPYAWCVCQRAEVSSVAWMNGWRRKVSKCFTGPVCVVHSLTRVRPCVLAVDSWSKLTPTVHSRSAVCGPRSAVHGPRSAVCGPFVVIMLM